ncbi:MAG TPA: sigma-70 family RNA polymerase sigma factor [Candidatus Aquilonibacter sp.]|nr:sigma-70 family RNA polymerase sigma factor [Candidatus Aquilonibacter sp.]
MPPKDAHDERLLIAAAQQDPARFTELYEAHFERVYAFVARRLRNRDDAEDVTAEVFRDALANLGKFEWRGAPFAAWLYRIAANAIADRWQRAAREQASPLPADPPDDSAAADPEETEKRARLFRLVGTLPADQRRVIEMRFAEGKSIAEIARELRRSGGAVKQLQFRAIQALRAAVEKAPRAKAKKPVSRHG